MRSTRIITALIAMLLLGGAPLLTAQTATGEVNGTVTDPSGALLAGAQVRLTNQATGLQTQVTTNDSGYFVLIGVQPGSYSLKVEKQGFKSSEVANFKVGVNSTVTQNLALSVGTATEVVEVTGVAPLVDSSTTELGTVIETRAVNDLPLNGRNFTQLLTLTPGVTPVSTSQNRSIGCCEGNVGLPGSGFSDGSFHGQNNRSKLYFYDGIINTNVRGPTYIVIPNIDLLQEFKVVGHDAKAEFGGAAGGVVNLVSKSGGNTFHGSAFEYVRNNFFDARNTFADGHDACTIARCGAISPFPAFAVPSGPTPFHQNQFGAVATGPIIKNKTFLSVRYDGLRYSQADPNLSPVPNVGELLGDFTNSGNQRQAIFNPYSTRITNPAACNATTGAGCNYTRDQFRCDAAGNPLPVGANNQQSQTTGATCFKIPQALIFAPMQKFLQTYSAAPNIIDPTGTNNFIRNRATLNNSNSYTARVDHRFRDADNVFFRYTEQRNTILTPIGDSGSTGGGSQGRNYGGGWTHVFSPSLILDVRAGYAGRPGVDAGQQNTHAAGTAPMATAGFKDIDKYSGLLVDVRQGSAYTGGGNNNIGIRGPAPRENPNWSVAPGISWLKGRHNLKIGAWYIDAKRIQLNTFQTYTFGTGPTAQISGSNTGNSVASALLGFPSSFTAQLPIPHGGPVRFEYASWAGYIQDEWKIRPTITLSAGLRYDYVTQPHTLDGRLWNSLDLAHQRYIIGATAMPPLCSVAASAPCIPDAFQTDPHVSNVVLAGKKFFAPPPIKDNWGPRVGLAWQLTPKTVLRGGYGLYWDSITARSQYAQNDLEAMVWPDAVAFNGSANPCSNGNTCAFTNGTAVNIIQQQGLGFAVPKPVYTTAAASQPWASFPNQGDDPRYKDGYAQQWNFEVQRELSPSMMISAAYAGAKSGRLPYGAANANSASQATRCAAQTQFAPTGGCTAAENATIDGFRQMPWVVANLTYSRSIGFAHYNALETRFQKRMSNGLYSLVSYTWGKATDVSSGYFNVENGNGGGSTIQNYYDQNLARGQSSFNISQFVSWATVYELPFGRGKHWATSGPLSWIVGDWQANYVFQMRSGAPYQLQVSGDVANLRGTSSSSPTYGRPNLVADPFVAGPVSANPDPGCATTISAGGKAADATHTARTWFNPCAFGVPFGAFGNLGRNPYTGPHVTNMDFSMFKSVHVGERFNVQFRFEAFNVFNIQNYNVPDSTFTVNSGTVSVPAGTGACSGSTAACTFPAIASGTVGTVGKITSLAQGTTPRQLQFGLRLQF